MILSRKCKFRVYGQLFQNPGFPRTLRASTLSTSMSFDAQILGFIFYINLSGTVFHDRTEIMGFFACAFVSQSICGVYRNLQVCHCCGVAVFGSAVPIVCLLQLSLWKQRSPQATSLTHLFLDPSARRLLPLCCGGMSLKALTSTSLVAKP